MNLGSRPVGIPAVIAVCVSLAFSLCAAHAETPLERGTYLMRGIVGCGNCHTPKGPDGHALQDQELAGGVVFKTPGFDAVASNITPDPATGIGNWTDDQIVDAIRNGKRPDGTTIGPPMPIEFYRDMSDTDVRALVAYLRTVKPIAHTLANIHLQRTAARIVWPDRDACAGHIAGQQDRLWPLPGDDRALHGMSYAAGAWKARNQRTRRRRPGTAGVSRRHRHQFEFDSGQSGRHRALDRCRSRNRHYRWRASRWPQVGAHDGLRLVPQHAQTGPGYAGRLSPHIETGNALKEHTPDAAYPRRSRAMAQHTRTSP